MSFGNQGMLLSSSMSGLPFHPFVTDLAKMQNLTVATLADLPTAGPPYEGVLGKILGSASAGTSGPLNPATLSNSTTDGAIGPNSWSNPGNATTSDDNYATCVCDGDNSHYLKALNFGFAISSGATINGVMFEFEVSKVAGGSTTQMDRCRLVKGGVVGATDKANVTAWTTTDTYLACGGPTELWGTTLSYSDVNASTFGVVLQASANTGATILQVDHVRATVYYTGAAVVGDVYRCNRLSDGSYAWEVFSTGS